MLNDLLRTAIWLKLTTMAPKRYTRERLEGIAADSAVKMKGFVPNCKLTCEYLQRGTDELVKGSDMLNFIWKTEAGYVEFHLEDRSCWILRHR